MTRPQAKERTLNASDYLARIIAYGLFAIGFVFFGIELVF